MAVPRLLGQQQSANIKVSKTAITNLEQAAKLYAVDNSGEPPTSIDELLNKREDGTAALLDKLPTDAWNNELHYEYSRSKDSDFDGPKIWSNGPNTKDEKGSGDDIDNSFNGKPEASNFIGKNSRLRLAVKLKNCETAFTLNFDQ